MMPVSVEPNIPTWPSKKGPVAITEMEIHHLVAAIRYVEHKAAYAIQQLTFVSGVVHLDLVSMVPTERVLRAMIAPQYPFLRIELERRKAVADHLRNGCDDHKCPYGCNLWEEHGQARPL